MLNRTLKSMVALSATVALGSAAFAAPALAASVAAPGQFKAQRNTSDRTELNLQWREVAGAHHYTVTLFDGQRDSVRVVEAGQTQYTFSGLEDCQRYRARVAAVANDGTVASTPVAWIDRAAPGSVGGVEVSRTEGGAVANVSWKPPSSTGLGPLTGYRVRVKQLSTGEFISDRTSPDTQETVSNLQPNREYAVKITALNDYGSCNTSTVMLRQDKPSQPVSLGAIRDPNEPRRVRLGWGRPVWAGYGPITAYQVGYRRPGWKNPKWVDVAGDATGVDLDLDPDVRWSFHVRAFNGNARSKLSKELWFEQWGSAAGPAADPNIHITEQDGVVRVTLDGTLETRAKYARMNVAITPTGGGQEFADDHTITNEAGEVIFTAVPCGTYRIVVTGQGVGNVKEFGRLMVDRCDLGLMEASNWKLLYGKSDFIGNDVDMRYGRESRVISTLDRTNPDMAVSTKATMRQGDGYVVWTRASVGSGAAVSGYALQVHPNYARINAGFGQAVHLTLWENGKECGTRLARVKWPEGVDVHAEQSIMVAVRGNTYEAYVAGQQIISIPDLDQAVADSGCGMAAPSGAQVGFRTWSPEGKTTFRGTKVS